MQIDLAKYRDMPVPRNVKKKKLDWENLHSKIRAYDRVSPRFFSSTEFQSAWSISLLKKNIGANLVLRMIENAINFQLKLLGCNLVWNWWKKNLAKVAEKIMIKIALKEILRRSTLSAREYMEGGKYRTYALCICSFPYKLRLPIRVHVNRNETRSWRTTFKLTSINPFIRHASYLLPSLR